LAGAGVRVLDAGPEVRTDEHGEFLLSALPTGTQILEVRHLGYRLVREPVELRSGRLVRHDVRLESVVTLDSVAVVAEHERYKEFETHRKSAIEGKFLTEAAIERLHVTAVSDVLASVPGFSVKGQGPNAEVFSSRGGGLGGCQPVIVVDNVRIGSNGINKLPAALLGAMEIYTSMFGAPPQFKSPCGTIMIWTKR